MVHLACHVPCGSMGIHGVPLVRTRVLLLALVLGLVRFSLRCEKRLPLLSWANRGLRVLLPKVAKKTFVSLPQFKEAFCAYLCMFVLSFRLVIVQTFIYQSIDLSISLYIPIYLSPSIYLSIGLVTVLQAQTLLSSTVSFWSCTRFLVVDAKMRRLCHVCGLVAAFNQL